MKGATNSKVQIEWVMRYFNPRTREGCDETIDNLITDPDDFNPRTREGCDEIMHGIVNEYRIISIHAPVKGATLATKSP